MRLDIFSMLLLTLLVGACVRNAVNLNRSNPIVLIEDHQEAPVYRIFYDENANQFIIRSWSYDHALEVMRELCEESDLICASVPAGVVLHVDVLTDLRGPLREGRSD